MGLTKRWSEPPPAVRSHFRMTKTVSIEATLALGGGLLQLCLVRPFIGVVEMFWLGLVVALFGGLVGIGLFRKTVENVASARFRTITRIELLSLFSWSVF